MVTLKNRTINVIKLTEIAYEAEKQELRFHKRAPTRKESYDEIFKISKLRERLPEPRFSTGLLTSRQYQLKCNAIYHITQVMRAIDKHSRCLSPQGQTSRYADPVIRISCFYYAFSTCKSGFFL